MTAPLFSSESELTVVVPRTKSASEWSAIARNLRLKAAFPLTNASMGRRYRRAVKAYFRDCDNTAVSPETKGFRIIIRETGEQRAYWYGA
jgi:hypothetical protein